MCVNSITFVFYIVLGLPPLMTYGLKAIFLFIWQSVVSRYIWILSWNQIKSECSWIGAGDKSGIMTVTNRIAPM